MIDDDDDDDVVVVVVSTFSFSEVFKGLYAGRPVAIKRLLMEKQTLDALAEFWAEIELMRSARSVGRWSSSH